MFLKRLTYTTWGLLLLAIVVTLITLNNVKKENEYDWTQQFEQEGIKNTRIIEEQLERIKRELMGIASLLKVTKSVTRSGFKSYTSSLLEKSNFIKSLQWVPRVKQEQRSSLESMAQNDGLINFKFTTLNKNSTIIPAPLKSEYFPIYYMEPLIGNEPYLGFDISTQPILLTLMNQARDTGKTVAITTSDLIHKYKKTKLMMFICPFYEGQSIPQNIESRKRLFLGTANGTYEIKNLIKEIIAPYIAPGMFLTVFDYERKNKLYGNFKSDSLIKKEIELKFSQIHWILVWQGSLAFQQGPNRLHNWLSAVVLILIVCIAIIFQILSSRARRIENEVRLRTNELKKLKNQLEEKNLSLNELIKVKNELLGMASHDLRNPITSIQGYSEFLLKKGSSINEDTRDDFLNIINSASDNILELLNDLLSLSAIESGQLILNLQQGNLRSLIEERIRLYTHLALEKNIKFEIKCHDNTIVSFDPPRIGQVLDNLLTNAIKFSPVDGVIEIIMESGNNHIKVTISDEGSGIRSEDLDDLFKPFKKFDTNLTENKKGTGLGLAIAKKMIELHNGSLMLTPSKKQGASFTFELPVN